MLGNCSHDLGLLIIIFLFVSRPRQTRIIGVTFQNIINPHWIVWWLSKKAVSRFFYSRELTSGHSEFPIVLIRKGFVSFLTDLKHQLAYGKHRKGPVWCYKKHDSNENQN